MNKKLQLSLFACASVALILLNSYSSQSPGGYTGSTSDGKTCGTNGGCHNVAANTQNMIATDIPSTGYKPGEVYNIKIKATHSGAKKFGFEFVTEGADGTAKGVVKSNNQVGTLGGNQRATHNASTSSADSTTWDFQWTAPAKGTGNLNMYVAVIAANGDGGNSGDALYTWNSPISEEATASIASKSKNAIEIYPNPCSSSFQLKNYENTKGKIEIVNLSGEIVYSQNVTTTVNVSHLSRGAYLVRITEGGTTLVGKLMLK